jgi:hypothetical protein
VKTTILALALALAPVAATAGPEALTGTQSHTYDCTIDLAQQDARLPQGGRAHVVINGRTQRATVTLRDVLDSNFRPVPNSTLTYLLTVHIEPTPGYPGLMIAWDPDVAGTARGMIDNYNPDNPDDSSHIRLTTDIPNVRYPNIGWFKCTGGEPDRSDPRFKLFTPEPGAFHPKGAPSANVISPPPNRGVAFGVIAALGAIVFVACLPFVFSPKKG